MNGFEALELMKLGEIVYTKGNATCLLGLIDGKISVVDECGGVVDTEYSYNFNGQYEKYKTQHKTGWERVNHGKLYYSIEGRSVVQTKETAHSFDDNEYEWANYFSTQKKAKEIHFKQTLFRKLQRFSDENGGNEIDLNDSKQTKYFIYYSHEFKRIKASYYRSSQEFGQVYFISEEVANKAIELFYEELNLYFTKY